MYIPDAVKHNMFSKIFGEKKEITVKIQEQFYTKADCISWINNYLYVNRDAPRPIMMQYQATRQNKVRVYCNETGEEFESLTECATKHGLSRSALSNHCNNVPGYNTVNGFTYRYL